MCVCVKSLQSCRTLWLYGLKPPGSSVHGIHQARILEWVAMPSSRDLPNPGIESMSLMSPALTGEFFTTGTTWEASNLAIIKPKKKKKVRASLVVQWLRIFLAMQETPVWTLVQKDPTCQGAPNTMSHNYGACAPESTAPKPWVPRARALQKGKLPPWDALARN